MSDLRIHAALSPRVAVLSSPDVDRVVQANGIPDLPTLLRPFESSVERLSVRTSQLETRICDRFPLRFDPYSLFNPDVTRAISSSSSLAAPRPSAVGQSQEELLDRVNHLIASNIKKWDAKVPRLGSNTEQVVEAPQNQDEDGDDKSKHGRALDETLVKLQQGSLEDTAPWFAAVQELVFAQRKIAKHETFGHPIAVLLAVSSASPDPMNDFAKLYEAATQSSPFPAHPYINTDTLKYYVLIHDVRTSGTDLASSKEILEQVKKTYGLHCCLLAINSASEDRAAPPAELAALWSAYIPSTPMSPGPKGSSSDSTPSDLAIMLDEEDVKRIKGFIRELTAQSIVPFMERYVQHTGEHLANSRKGLTNRLFGASRKLFGGVASISGSSADKSGSSAAGGLSTAGGYDPQNEFYPYTSIEAQTRRLADFAFTIRDYKLAASMYDLGRKDFANDKANRHAAGATEMFGLSHLMIMFTSRSAPIDVDSYLAQACYEYGLRSTARANEPLTEENHALRATLLYYEAYRMLGYLRPAPAGLLRMSQRSDEVLAPLLLEQAALACLQLRPEPSLRKFGLFNITAAHKYQACGQKVLSLRCYAQAAVIYRQKGWSLIENHLEHELGMQAYNDGDSDVAVAHLIKLIRPSVNSSAEHERFLQDVQTAYKYSGQAEQGAENAKLKTLALPFPIFDTASAALRFVPESSASATSTIDGAIWDKLERDLVDHGLGERTLPDGSKQRRKRPTSQTSTQARQVPIDQAFWLDVAVRNPLAIDLVVDSIRPVLQISDSRSDDTDAAALSDDQVGVEDAGKIVLGPLEHRRVRIALRVKEEFKSLRVTSMAFRLAETIHLAQHLDKKGLRLNSTKEHRTSTVYGPDLSLAVSVHGPRPTLTAQILHVPQQLFLGEQVRLKVLLKNEGSTRIENLRALCDTPGSATFQAEGESSITDSEAFTMPNHLGPTSPQAITNVPLEAGQESEVELIVRPSQLGSVKLAWLLPFSSEDGETYLSRLAFATEVSPAVQLSVQTRPHRGTACLHEAVIEARNLLMHDEVHIDTVSLLGPHWKLAGSSAETARAVTIAPLQVWRGRLQIEAVRSQGEDDNGEQFTATKLQDLLLSRDTRRPPPFDVKLHLSQQSYGSDTDSEDSSTWSPSLHAEARKVWRIRSLASTFPTMTTRDRLGAFTLWDPRDLDVVLHFTVHAASSSSRRVGQAQVFGLQPGPLRSQIRAITHPRLDDTASKGGQVRSLYAETIKEKASLLSNILSSHINAEQCPAVVHVDSVPSSDGGGTRKYTFVVRNFSDRYEISVEIQLLEEATGDGWVGRKTLRCTLQPGAVAELGAKRKGEGQTGAPRFAVVTEAFLTDGEQTKELIARYVEQY